MSELEQLKQELATLQAEHEQLQHDKEAYEVILLARINRLQGRNGQLQRRLNRCKCQSVTVHN